MNLYPQSRSYQEAPQRGANPTHLGEKFEIRKTKFETILNDQN